MKIKTKLMIFFCLLAFGMQTDCHDDKTKEKDEHTLLFPILNKFKWLQELHQRRLAGLLGITRCITEVFGISLIGSSNTSKIKSYSAVKGFQTSLFLCCNIWHSLCALDNILSFDSTNPKHNPKRLAREALASLLCGKILYDEIRLFKNAHKISQNNKLAKRDDSKYSKNKILCFLLTLFSNSLNSSKGISFIRELCSMFNLPNNWGESLIWFPLAFSATLIRHEYFIKLMYQNLNKKKQIKNDKVFQK